MSKFTRFAPVIVGLAIVSACGENVDQVRAENAAADAIPAGIYGNIALSEASGGLAGYELKLPQGSESEAIQFVRCDQSCPALSVVPVRRGLNGLFFDVPSAAGQMTPVALERTADGVSINVDWGNGLETVPLVKIEREWGLRVARGE